MKKIIFEYIGKYAYDMCEKPYPSIENIPEWHKKMKPYSISEDNPKGSKLMIIDGHSNATAKKCTPMLDSISFGYTVPLWSDVLVSNKEDQISIDWRVKKDVFQLHGPSSREIPAPEGYDSVVFKFITHFRIRTPPGYSCLITSPSGHYDLPFKAINGIIDTDKSVIDTNIPCWIKSNTNGIIEKGTPIAQIFPFKRDNWEKEFEIIDEEKQRSEEDLGFLSTIKNNYVKNIWSRKTFK